MKRVLLSLVALVITSVCFAQDVIVQTIGPNYAIDANELQDYNFEIGGQDTITNSNYNPNIVTNETATQFSNDEKLLDIYNNRNKKVKTPKIKKVITPEILYKKGKRMKVAGYVIGGTLTAGGIACFIMGLTKDKYHDQEIRVNTYNNYINDIQRHNHRRCKYFYIGDGVIAGGFAVGIPLILKGSSLQKNSTEHIQSLSVISQDINFENGSSLNLGIDILSDNYSFTKTPGVGVRFNF